MLYKEQQSIEDSYNKINKLVYGKNGLITFLNRLFFNTTHENRHEFHYYFALKKHLCFLDSYTRPTPGADTPQPVEEKKLQVPEESKEMSSKETKDMSKEISSAHSDHDSSQKLIRKHNSRKRDVFGKECCMVFEVEKKLQHDSVKMIELIRRGDHDWMIPQEWEEWYMQIRKSY